MNKIKNVLIYCSDPEIKTYADFKKDGGSGTLMAVLNVAYGLADNGLNVNLAGDINSYNRNISDIENLNFIDVKNDEQFIALCELGNFTDVIIVGHAWTVFNHQIKFADNVIYWAHNWINIKDRICDCEKGVVDQLIFVSRYHFLKSFLALKCNLFALKYMSWIYNSLRLEDYTFTDLNNIKNKPLDIAFLSYPSKNKGFPEVIEIFDFLKANNVNVNLHIFGTTKMYSSNNDDYGECTELLLNSNGSLKDGIITHGMLGKTQLNIVLNNIDLAISGLTGSETFCYALAESLAKGIVVVSLNKGGQTDYIIQNKNGYLVSNSRDAALSILKYYNLSREDKLQMKHFANISMKKFAEKKIIEKWYQLIINRSFDKGLSSILRKFSK